MEVRTLLPEEYAAADRISRFCFHDRSAADEATQSGKPQSLREDWGAFAPDGTLAAHIINNHFEMNLNGGFVPMGGVGAVSTLPEFRSGGAIRQI
ncbi:MAG: GNAT family N-acetyltransferase, partial [Clostridia bacterium]|nr:GNAT family N-acetyltransferase [Clostridia bacterium]